MMNNEIMVNEEIIDAVEEAVTSKTFEEGLVYGSVGTAVILVGGNLLYKKVLKPAYIKFKAKKEAGEVIDADGNKVADGVEYTESEA